MSTITSSGPAVKSTRKPRTCKPARRPRFIRVLCDLPTAGEKAVRIEERGTKTSTLTHYYVRVLPCDFGFATSWEKWTTDGGDGTAYECNIGGPGGTIESEDGELITDEGPACCCCKGFEKHGHCKHVEATRALLAANKL